MGYGDPPMGLGILGQGARIIGMVVGMLWNVAWDPSVSRTDSWGCVFVFEDSLSRYQRLKSPCRIVHFVSSSSLPLSWWCSSLSPSSLSSSSSAGNRFSRNPTQ